MLISAQAEALFVTASELDADARDEFLDRSCGTDTRLREEIDSLLTAANESEAYFTDLSQRFGLYAAADDSAALPGDRQIGSWRLLSVLGRGGMGTVYLVERADEQFEQRAAMKILPQGVGALRDEARFLAERQILARLEHENIARLLDGGVSDDGTPYFVMDYVVGEPIGRFCDDRGLTVDERLQLFLSVCDAVQYAHGSSIVHRDIKSNNVLVEDGGRARLLDFGVAKMLDTNDDGSDLTRIVQRPMTPAYASPEMVRGKAVDVRTDVYSLGVLLYELLTGRLPLQVGGLSAAAIENEIAGRMPPAASEAVDDEAAERRGCSAKQLRARLQGDLDTIAAKALAKDAADRYASVERLAADIRNYLQGLPVAARPPSLAYQARKFVARHRLGVAFAVSSVVMLLSITVLAVFHAVTTERQSRVIAAERDRAREITSFLIGVFQSADPDRPAADLTALQILSQGRERIGEELSDQPEMQAELLKAMSEVYNGMRLNEESKQTLYQELALRERLTGVDSAPYADVLLRLAQITDVEGDYDSSLGFAEQALAISESLGDRERRAWAHTRVGRVLHLQGDYGSAESHYRQSLAEYTDLYGVQSEQTIKAMEHLANLLNHQEKFRQSLEMFEEVLRARERLFGPEHSELGPALLGLGSVLGNLDRQAEAAAAYERAYALNEKIFGPDNRRNMYVINGLGKVAEAMQDYELAAVRYAEAGRLVEKFFGEHGNLGITKRNLATAYSLDNRFDLAVPVYRDSIAILEKRMPDHWMVGDARWRLGHALLETGRAGEAEAFIVSGLEILAAKRGPGHESTREAIAAAVDLYETLDRPDEASRYRRRLNGD